MGSFRLRPGKDDDLITALAALPKSEDKSDAIRAALRLYFRINETPQSSPPCRLIPLSDSKSAPTMLDADDKLNDLLGGL